MKLILVNKNRMTIIKHFLCCLQTVSFLTYLLRSFADCIRPHEDSISKSIVSLLVSCPDSVSIRKVRPVVAGGSEMWLGFCLVKAYNAGLGCLLFRFGLLTNQNSEYFGLPLWTLTGPALDIARCLRAEPSKYVSVD